MALVSCFSPWEGGEGTITLVFGDSTSSIHPVSAAAAIASFNADITSYQIILTGPGGITQTHSVEESGLVRIPVTPGDWNVTVRAIGDVPSSLAGLFPGQTMLRTIGFADGPVTVSAGQTVGAEVTMMPALEISSHDQLFELGAILGNLDVSEAILILMNNITAEGEYTITGDITLISEEDFTIARDDYPDNNDALFSIPAGGSLTLGKPGMSGRITIDGRRNLAMRAEGSLINISNGTLVMHDGITLTGNFRPDQTQQSLQTQGGAAYVSSNARFYMLGGMIFGNFSLFGGGVAVRGHFEMSGGSIFGNTANTSGNAVNVWSPGTAIIFGDTRAPGSINENLP